MTFDIRTCDQVALAATLERMQREIAAENATETDRNDPLDASRNWTVTANMMESF